jgi:hypothetical protein
MHDKHFLVSCYFPIAMLGIELRASCTRAMLPVFFACSLFFKQGLVITFPGLASNCDPPAPAS